MAQKIGRLLNVAMLGVLTATTMSSCAAYRIGNPFLPAARIMVTAAPAILNSTVTYVASTKDFTYVHDQASFTLSSYPGDITPGVRFTDYELSFYDQHGTKVSDLLIPSRRMQINLYLPRGGGATSGGATSGGGTSGGSGKVDIPVLNDSVGQYASQNGFRNTGTELQPVMIKNTEPWSQSLSGKVTFYGQDDNMYPVQAEGVFTVNFQTNIQ